MNNFEFIQSDDFVILIDAEITSIDGGYDFDDFAEWYVDTCYTVANAVGYAAERYANGFVKGFNRR